MTQSLESAFENANQTLKKAQLPFWLRIAQYLCGICGLIIALGILKADDVTLSEGYQNAPGLYWAAGVCLAIWLILWIWGKHKEKAVLSTDESNQILSRFEGVNEASYGELGVPGDAKVVDVLSFFYKVKDGEMKVHEKGLQYFQYFNHFYLVSSSINNSQNLHLCQLYDIM